MCRAVASLGASRRNASQIVLNSSFYAAQHQEKFDIKIKLLLIFDLLCWYYAQGSENYLSGSPRMGGRGVGVGFLQEKMVFEWNIVKQVEKGETHGPVRRKGKGRYGQACGCVKECISFPKLSWIGTTQVYPLTVLEARLLN